MPMDRSFLDETQRLFEPAMGTESAAFLLYALARMVRLRNLLEVGLGYSTSFLALALRDAREECEADCALLSAGEREDQRRLMLIPPYFERDYRPCLHAIDDFSRTDSSALRVVEVLETLRLDHFLRFHKRRFPRLFEAARR